MGSTAALLVLCGSMILCAAGPRPAEAVSESPAPVTDSLRVPAWPCSLEVISSLLPPGDSGRFAPEAMAVDALGRLFVLDRAGGRISRVSKDGSWVPFGAGDQGGGRYPNLVSLFAQWGPDLYALDPAAGVLYQFDLDGRLRQTVSYQDGLTQADQGFVQVVDFALNRTGELLLLDRSGGRVLLFDRFGRYLTDLSSGASGAARPQSPARLAQDDRGQIFVLDPPGAWIRTFTREGTPGAAWHYADPATAAGTPLFCVAPWNRSIVVVARDGSWARVFDPGGRLQLSWTNPDSARVPLSNLVAGPDSILYLSCPSRGEIRRWRWIAVDHGGASRP